MKHKVLPLLLYFLVISFIAFAQETSIQENNPTSLKWYRVKTTHFNVLFPKGFDREAMRVANTLEFIHEPEAASMGVQPKPISVILQNQSSVSNGFVTLAPRRSEFYTMPPQNYNFLGTNDWLSLLASHEYRHVVQYQRSIVGFNKAMYYVFGQNALSVLAFAAVPQWFWEGDAVATETAFTKSGRGRIPNFGLLFRTNLLEGRSFNYNKQYLRSYKHNIPDHYVLGYHMITYLRNKTNNPSVWDNVATRTWKFPFPFAFTNSIRKASGMPVSKLYREMADSLSVAWAAETKTNDITSFDIVNPRTTKSYTDYLYPQILDDGSVLAVKTGIGDITTIVRIKDKVETKEFVAGPFNDAGMLSAAMNNVVWNEYRFDPRWRVKTFSVVKGYNITTGTNRDLSRKSRYSGAALSPDGTKVVTVESTTGYDVKMVVLDYNTNAIIKQFDNPGNPLIQMPRWSPDGKSIVAIKLTSEGKKISIYDYQSGNNKDVFDAGNENVGHPVLTSDNKYILYNSPYSGIDNIYALEIGSGKRYQVTSSVYGAYNPALTKDGSSIIYNDQTRDGMDIARMPFEPSKWKNIEDVRQPNAHYYDKLVEQEQHHDIMKDVPQKEFPVSKYKKANHLINVHSWGPFVGTDYTRVDFGLQSRDLLGTTVIDAGYLFDINERTGYYHTGISYQGLYPILDLNVLYGKRQYNTSAFGKDIKLTWDEKTVTGGFRVPLILTHSKYYTNLTFKNWVGVTQVSNFKNVVTRDGNVLYSQSTDRLVKVSDSLRFIFDTQVGNGNLLYNQATISFTRYLKQSRRDFNPKFGQTLDLELYSTPYGGDFKGKLAVARTTLFFPGILKHHSILLRAGYQNGTSGYETNRYSFRNRVFRPRGFSYPFDSEFASLSGNYAAPVWYPDLQFGPLLNIQRLRANVFYDYGRAVGTNWFYHDNGKLFYAETSRTYQSVGAEFTVDVNVMRLLPQLDLGLRVTMINPTNAADRKPVIEFVLGTLNL